jgi:hypothetical protein
MREGEGVCKGGGGIKRKVEKIGQGISATEACHLEL